MTIQTGVTTSLENFVDIFCEFAVANAGFTDGSRIPVNSSDSARFISKGGVYWIFANNPSFITGVTRWMNARMTYSAPPSGGTFSTSNPSGQDRFTRFSTHTAGETFSAGYFLYTQGIAVHCVLEVFPNVYNHISFGSIIKVAAFVGGEYLTAGFNTDRSSSTGYDFDDFSNLYPFDDSGSGTSSQTCYLRRSVGSNDSDDFAPIGQRTVTISSGVQNVRMVITPRDGTDPAGNGSGFLGVLLVNSPNQATERVALFPCYVRSRDPLAGSVANYNIIGTVPGVRVLNIQTLTPEEVVDTNWRVFPLAQKAGDPFVAPISANLGLAYQEIP